MICSVTSFNSPVSGTGYKSHILTSPGNSVFLEHIFCFPTPCLCSCYSLHLKCTPPATLHWSLWGLSSSAYLWSILWSLPLPSPIISHVLPLNLSWNSADQGSHPGYEMPEHSPIKSLNTPFYHCLFHCLSPFLDCLSLWTAPHLQAGVMSASFIGLAPNAWDSVWQRSTHQIFVEWMSNLWTD